MKHHMMITLLVIAVSMTNGELLVAQLPGGLPNNIIDGRGNARANSQIQSQIQQQVQGQVQSQIQAQANARMQADVNRAADLAQRVASNAQRQASAAQQRIAGTVQGNAKGNAQIGSSANASAQGQQNGERGMIKANGHAQASAQLHLPPGFVEADVELYDRIFGKHNPIRAREPEADNGRGAENGMKVRAVNYTETGVELAEQIHLAIQQRRAEISELRDRALLETKPELIEQADQMELVINTFVEAQARVKARAEADARENVKSDAETRLNSQSNGSIREKGK